MSDAYLNINTDTKLNQSVRQSEIPGRVERIPFSKPHYIIVLLSTLVILFDGLDTQLIAFALPGLSSEFGLSKMQAGAVASAGLFALFFGAMILGSLADYFGRKPTLLWTVGLYSLFSATTGLAWNHASLLVFRFLTGLGLGGGVPLATTMVSETVPAKYRGRLVGITVSGFCWGWVLAALMGVFIITNWGWRSAFYLTALPAVLVFILMWAIQESPRYLDIKGKTEEAKDIISRWEKSAGISAPIEGEVKLQPIVKAAGLPIGTIFSSQYTKRTVMCFVDFALSLFLIYGFSAWLPSLLFSMGFTLVKSFTYTLVIFLGAAIGQSCNGFILEYLGRRAGLTICWAIGAVFMALMAYTKLNPTLIMVYGFIASFMLIGNQVGLNVYASELFPTRIRSTAVGWSNAVGRIGAFLGPLIGAAVLSYTSDPRVFFGMFALSAVIIMVVTLALGPETKGKCLEELSK